MEEILPIENWSDSIPPPKLQWLYSLPLYIPEQPPVYKWLPGATILHSNASVSQTWNRLAYCDHTGLCSDPGSLSHSDNPERYFLRNSLPGYMHGKDKVRYPLLVWSDVPNPTPVWKSIPRYTEKFLEINWWFHFCLTFIPLPLIISGYCKVLQSYFSLKPYIF